jgi:ADP-heptose:LPS heptosyltransferase
MGLAGALAACDAVVANDSGPMHLAAAVGTPVVGLFGPTSPALGFAPVGGGAVSVHLGLHCSPCSRHGKTPCWRERRYCMEDLDPEVVFRALQRALTGGSDEKVLA